MSDLQCSREVLHIYESGREISTKTDIILPQEKFTTQQSPDLDSEESKVTKQRLKNEEQEDPDQRACSPTTLSH
jgi:hypothetical protein